MAWIVRGVTLALGVFLFVSALLGFASPRLDSSIWMLDARWMPPIIARVVVLALGLSVAWAGWSGCRGRTRPIGLVAGLALALLASIDATTFLVLLSRGSIASAFPMPASLLVCISGLGLAHIAWRGRGEPISGAAVREPIRLRARVIALAIATIGAFPFVQMLCFGWTDYRREADAVLVFGARAFADGSPSDALGDRILTACELMRERKCTYLILSGGPGDGAFHETDVMRRIAIDQGVAEEQILIDRDGLNTHASIVNAAAISKEQGIHRVLAVSHFYHLPRVKVEASRAGLAVFTVPADQRGQVLKKLPYFMAREAAAWWWSYAKGMAS